MNSTPIPATVTNTRGHPPKFGQFIIEKSKNFVGREFVFAAINEFLHKCDRPKGAVPQGNRGYFTIIGNAWLNPQI